MPFSQPFAYSSERHLRRHGPRGYADSQHFKPWLRDEFQFRCVYCLIRERWHPDGDGGFSVEHLRPRSRSPELAAEYDNLFYACCRCNAAKQDLEGILNPATEPLANHLLVSSNGATTNSSSESVSKSETVAVTQFVLRGIPSATAVAVPHPREVASRNGTPVSALSHQPTRN